jgi:arabinose-5-phosphate isomerase
MGPDLLTQTAGAVMTRTPRVTRPAALAAEALRLMTEVDPRVTVLFVIDEDRKPVGIIHMHDCLRAGVA